MDTDRLREVAPHYVAMVVLAYVVVGIVGFALGDLGFWPELVIIAVVVFAYRPVVMWLGVGPEAWKGE